MKQDSILVERGGLPTWTFTKNQYGQYECKQKRHTYRIVFDDPSCKPIWIGMIIGDALVTIEREIKATAVIFKYGRYVFDA